MSNASLLEKVDRFSAHNYKPLPVVLNRAEGARVWDVEGNEYLDFLAAYSAVNFGHQHPTLVKALVDQVGKLALCSRAFQSEEFCYFAEELAAFCGMEVMLPMNTGAEAVETAIKIARKWGYKKKGVRPDKAKILVAENNFHGRTITVVSFSTEEEYRDGFGPFTPGFSAVPFGDIQKLREAVDDDVVGILLEPIQAEAGILIPEAGYLTEVRKLCTENNILFLLDEIQTGLGRTGQEFCFQHEDAKPDLLILGKSLGGGLVPVSAVVGSWDAMDVIGPGEHGSTFGGNPVGAAVGRAAIKLLREGKYAQKANAIGAYVREKLEGETLPGVKEIRGKGALIGIEMEPSTGGARSYCEKLAARGVLCKETHTYVIRIAPPLMISEADLKTGVGHIIEVIKQGP